MNAKYATIEKKLTALPDEYLPEVIMFLDSLAGHHNKVSLPQKSKKNFFSMAGKIDIDEAALMEFRERSKI